MCQHTVRGGVPLIVPDIRADERCRSLPPDALGAVAYAGVPVRSARGHVVGTLCVIDTVPREFPTALMGVLAGLAADAAGVLEEGH